MRALLIVLILAVGGGVIWWFATRAESLSIGITSAAPLGDAAKVEKHLLGKGLMKQEMNKEELRLFFGDRFADLSAVTATEYDDAVPGTKHRVMLVKGQDGKLLGVAGAFRSGAMDFSMTGTKCEHFTAVYWIQVAGGKPVFKKLMRGGADRQEYFEAEVLRNGVTCRWTKEGGGGIVALPHEMHDAVAFSVR